MYDKRTQSLWSTIDGEPVIGPLVNQGIKLDVYPLVTTTWGEWLSQHPETLVLSLNTGYDRNYNEGEAYKEYYSTDALMFPVKDLKNELNKKEEVFIVRIKENEEHPVAYSVEKLISEKYLQDKIGERSITIVTSPYGNIRAYDSGNHIFVRYSRNVLFDSEDNQWEINDDYLINESGKKLNRLPAHRIFWFAWYASHIDTRLIK